jgi:hypothetical protein
MYNMYHVVLYLGLLFSVLSTLKSLRISARSIPNVQKVLSNVMKFVTFKENINFTLDTIGIEMFIANRYMSKFVRNIVISSSLNA